MRIPFKRARVSKRDSSTVAAAVEPALAPDQRRRVIEYGSPDLEAEPTGADDGAVEQEPATSEPLGPMSGW